MHFLRISAVNVHEHLAKDSFFSLKYCNCGVPGFWERRFFMLPMREFAMLFA